ncbi:hypothetical protein ACTFIU_004809 [Dictyostelium citrinum]
MGTDINDLDSNNGNENSGINNNSNNNNNLNNYNNYNSYNNNNINNKNNNNNNFNSNYNFNNNNYDPMYNSEIEKRSSGYYHDILINKNKESKNKRRFKYRVLTVIVGIFFVFSIASLLFFIFFSTTQSTFESFKFIQTKCHLKSIDYISKNQTHGPDSCQKLNEESWWYSYEKDFYKFNNNNAQYFNNGSSSEDNNSNNNNNNNNDNNNNGDEINSKNNLIEESNSGGGNSKGDISKVITCYQGLFHVSFNDTDNELQQGDIDGLWNDDLTKVDSYLHQIKINSTQTCYYNKHDNREIIWVKPPSSLFNIIFIVVIGLIIVIAFTVFVVIFRKAYGSLTKEQKEREEKANLLSNSTYYRYTSDKLYNNDD